MQPCCHRFTSAATCCKARTLLVSTKDLFLALLGVAVRGRVLAALAPTGMTKILLLAVIGSEAILDDVIAPAMKTGNDFGNHVLTLTHHSYHSSLAHYPELI